jgi:hypothetical protein
VGGPWSTNSRSHFGSLTFPISNFVIQPGEQEQKYFIDFHARRKMVAEDIIFREMRMLSGETASAVDAALSFQLSDLFGDLLVLINSLIFEFSEFLWLIRLANSFSPTIPPLCNFSLVLSFFL